MTLGHLRCIIQYDTKIDYGKKRQKWRKKVVTTKTNFDELQKKGVHQKIKVIFRNLKR
jgi:hypothetical protein